MVLKPWPNGHDPAHAGHIPPDQRVDPRPLVSAGAVQKDRHEFGAQRLLAGRTGLHDCSAQQTFFLPLLTLTGGSIALRHSNGCSGNHCPGWIKNGSSQQHRLSIRRGHDCKKDQQANDPR